MSGVMAVQIIRDIHRIINKNSNLKQTFVIGSWHIRGLQPKNEEIAESLANKDVDICGLQGTKCRAEEFEERDYKFLSLDRKCAQHGLGFAVGKNLKSLQNQQINDRISYLIVEKKKTCNMKTAEDDTKLL